VTLKLGFGVTQGHRKQHYSIEHIRLCIRLPYQLCLYLLPFPRYSRILVENSYPLVFGAPFGGDAQRHCRVFNHCQGPRRCVRQSAYHGRPHRCSQPIVLLPHPAAQIDKTVIDTRGSEDTGVRFCQQSHRLLQQHPRWCQWSTATEAAISPECSCTSGH